jgi:hypothetical protein
LAVNLRGDFAFMIGIYKITSPTKKVYIGQSVNVERRFKEYKKLKCKSQPILNNSFLKHGVDNHIFEVIESCNVEKLNERERFYQDLYSVLDNGLNCRLTTTKDKSGFLSAETKLKMSLFQKSNTHWLYKKHSDITKTKISNKSKGNKYNLGKKHSEETKLKMSKWQKGISKSNNRLGVFHLEETKLNLSKNRIGYKNPNAKIVIDLSTGIFYYTVIEVSVCFNIKYDIIKSKLNGKIKNNTNFKYI